MGGQQLKVGWTLPTSRLRSCLRSWALISKFSRPTQSSYPAFLDKNERVQKLFLPDTFISVSGSIYNRNAKSKEVRDDGETETPTGKGVARALGRGSRCPAQ